MDIIEEGSELVGAPCGYINYADNETDPELLAIVASTTTSGYQEAVTHYVKCGVMQDCLQAITGVDVFGQPIYRCSTASPGSRRFYGSRGEVKTICVGNLSELP
jgi:hypothetical protein